MQYYRLILAILAQFFCSQHSAFATSLTEREELTLSLNQLNQIEASLNRAQQSARTGINERYYFDYPRIHGDITTLRSGIDNYLTPPCPTERYSNARRTIPGGENHAMSPEQISAFQAASQMKPDAVSLVMLGLFSAFLLLWMVWMLKSAENP